MSMLFWKKKKANILRRVLCHVSRQMKQNPLCVMVKIFQGWEEEKVKLS